MQGMANSAWGDDDQRDTTGERDQARAFISGIPAQAGTALAGVLLLAGEESLGKAFCSWSVSRWPCWRPLPAGGEAQVSGAVVERCARAAPMCSMGHRSLDGCGGHRGGVFSGDRSTPGFAESPSRCLVRCLAPRGLGAIAEGAG